MSSNIESLWCTSENNIVLVCPLPVNNLKNFKADSVFGKIKMTISYANCLIIDDYFHSI